MKNIRRKRGLTQKQLAERLQVNQSTISRIEKGFYSSVTIDRLFKLAKILDICPVHLLLVLTKYKCRRNCPVYK